MLTYEIYPRSSGPGFAYRIFLADGTVQTIQRFAPGAPGFEPMTESAATNYAKADIAALLSTQAQADSPGDST